MEAPAQWLANYWFMVVGAAVFAFALINFARNVWKAHQRRVFQDPPGYVIYEERFASGRSLRNWRTKLGGANNCLKLLVYDSELWIAPMFPFAAIGEQYDLAHRILLSKITDVKVHSGFFSRSIVIEYQGTDMEAHRVEIRPRHFETFIEALKERKVRVNAI